MKIELITPVIGDPNYTISGLTHHQFTLLSKLVNTYEAEVKDRLLQLITHHEQAVKDRQLQELLLSQIAIEVENIKILNPIVNEFQQAFKNGICLELQSFSKKADFLLV